MPDDKDQLDTEKDASSDNAGKEETKGNDKARPSLRRIMTFSQYMRQENEEDIELITRVREKVNPPDGWEEEDHRDDFRPSYWFKKDKYVIELYSTMGAVAVLFGELRKDKEPSPSGGEDFTMINPFFPALELPSWNEEEDEEDLELTAEKFDWYVDQCEEYISELEKEKDDQSKLDKTATVQPLLGKATTVRLGEPREKVSSDVKKSSPDSEKSDAETKISYKTSLMRRFGKAFFKRSEG